jgi:hypothetical protein
VTSFGFELLLLSQMQSTLLLLMRRDISALLWWGLFRIVVSVGRRWTLERLAAWLLWLFARWPW